MVSPEPVCSSVYIGLLWMLASLQMLWMLALLQMLRQRGPSQEVWANLTTRKCKCTHVQATSRLEMLAACWACMGMAPGRL